MPIPIAPIITAGASLLGNAFGAAGTEYSNRKAFERMRQHDIEMFNLQKQDRDEQNRYNAPAAQVARLAAAGINPASVFGSGTSVAESAPVSGSAGASASGTDWSITGRMAQDALIPLQMEQIQKGLDLTQSQIDKNKSETDKTTKEAAWIDRLNTAKEQSLSASTRLDQGRYDLLSTQKKEMLANIDKLEREADSEVEKQFLMASQRLLNDASVREINSLLPFKAAFLKAETANQRAQAGLALANEMYQRGLIDEGYITHLCNKVKADIKQSEGAARVSNADAFAREWKNSVMTGVDSQAYQHSEDNNWTLFWDRASMALFNIIPGASHPMD